MELRIKKANELKTIINCYNENIKKTEKLKALLKIFKQKDNTFNELLIRYMKEENHDVINFNNILNIENVKVHRVNPVSKKYLEKRTLELCAGDEEKMKIIYERIFSKDNLTEYEVKKIKIKDLNNP